MSAASPIHAFAAMAAKTPLVPYDYEPAPLGAHDVELEVSHCGLCFSDVHLIDDDWKRSSYPLVPGHEVVGKVVRRGPEVAHLELGARVGVGWQNGACFACELCHAGLENLCLAQTATAVGHFGGLANRMIADARFALPIPDALGSAAAAPLLCGGVTVYSPMKRFGVSASTRIGIVGIGGLGHMAIAIARALGAEITAFTSTPAKYDEARRMGAHHVLASNDIKAIRALDSSLDLILSTVHAKLDYNTYMQALRPNGTFCMLGGGTGMISILQGALHGQRSITVGEIGNRAAIAELLAFSARHGIAPQIEVAAMADCQAQVERLRRNEVRYRAVLENR